jgi:hypothetical protein
MFFFKGDTTSYQDTRPDQNSSQAIGYKDTRPDQNRIEQNKKCEAIVFLVVWTGPGPGSSTLPILLATVIYQLYCSDVSSSTVAARVPASASLINHPPCTLPY